MRRELENQVELTPEQSNLLDNHSMVTQLNILEQQLALLNTKVADPRLGEFLELCLDVLLRLPKSSIQPMIPEMEKSCISLKELLEELGESHPKENPLIRGLLEIVSIGKTRLQELKIDRHIWRETPIEEFHSKLSSFLKATELVSGQRFRIGISPESLPESSYQVDMQFNFPTGKMTAPVILNDIIRDLVANSRKYSEPGTRIHLQLSQAENHGLILKVSDSGAGIPEDEIEQVVQYGYRATNVMDRRTMGGGFGLTKAFQICKQSRGRFFIESEQDKGTTIELSLYPPH